MSSELTETEDILSARGMRWRLTAPADEVVSDFARQTGLDPVLSAFLAGRDVQPEEVETFLNPTLRELFPDPSSLQDLDLAAGIIVQHIIEGKKVAVFADYDVDGATSAAQLIRYFRHFDRELTLYVPDRLKEGYGPSPEAFAKLKAQGVDLVITVDCGAAAKAALKHAEEINLDVIVLDHHLMGEDVPECLALVNPNRLDCESGQGHLAAVGVVFVLTAALNRYFRTQLSKPAHELPDVMSYLDLCALGTLCDMAPLKGVNRAFVNQGLKVIARDESVGLLALSQVSGRSAPRSVTDLTFGIGPQLNAGGRIGDPWLATRLLASDSFEEALPLAEELNALNEQRKQVEAQIQEAARIQITTDLERYPDRKILVCGGEGWHPGVIGIVAGRLKDEFMKPVIVIGWGDGFGDVARGSGRSVPGINLGEAISRAANAEILIDGGGHAMAGGLSIDPKKISDLQRFFDTLNWNVDSALKEARILDVDMDVFASACTVSLLDIVEQAGPYGAESPKPVFRIKSAQVSFARIVGANHKKVTLNDGTGNLDGICWRCADKPLGEYLAKNRVLDVVGHLSRNSWQGRESIQFEILDAIARN